MATPIQLRRGVASAWTLADPILRAGEAGVELDLTLLDPIGPLLKVGDGVRAWTDLPYLGAADVDLSGYVLTGDVRLSDARVPLAHTHAFADLTSKPSTLAGYGIPAITKADVGLGLVENVALSTGNAATATLAASATVLANARLINGVSFNGSGDITVPAAAGTLTGATLAANVLASSLTSVGTLVSLTVTAPIAGSVTGAAGSVAASALTGTALAATVVSSSLTSVGILAGLSTTGQHKGADGTAALPAFSFTSEPTKGFWSSGALETTHEGRLKISSTGYLLMNGSAPIYTTTGIIHGNAGTGTRLNINANGLPTITANGGNGIGLDVVTNAVLKIRTVAQTGYATVDALGYSVSGVAGASKAAGPVTSITVVNGIVTACS